MFLLIQGGILSTLHPTTPYVQSPTKELSPYQPVHISVFWDTSHTPILRVYSACCGGFLELSYNFKQESEKCLRKRSCDAVGEMKAPLFAVVQWVKEVLIYRGFYAHCQDFSWWAYVFVSSFVVSLFQPCVNNFIMFQSLVPEVS